MKKNDPQFGWNVHSYLNEYIKFGDTKAALICGLTGPLVAGLIGLNSWKIGWDVVSIFGLIAISLLGVAFCFGFAAIWPNLLTVKVRRSKSIPTSLNTDGKETPAAGFIFWKNILVHTNANVFAGEMAKLSNEDEVAQVGHHCYELAGIANRKYKLVAVASRFFATGLIALAFFFVIHWRANSSVVAPKGSESGTDRKQTLTDVDLPRVHFF